MITKTVEHADFGTLEIRGTSQALWMQAHANLKKEGIQVPTDNTDSQKFGHLTAEACRLMLVSWRLPDGSDPLAGLRPAEARKFLSEQPGLMDGIASVAAKIAKQAKEAFEAVAGN